MGALPWAVLALTWCNGPQASTVVHRCSSALSRSWTRTRDADHPQGATRVRLGSLLPASDGFCGQARAREEDVPASIARSGIRPTQTPAVMLTKRRFGMEALPAYEPGYRAGCCCGGAVVPAGLPGGSCRWRGLSHPADAAVPVSWFLGLSAAWRMPGN
ncbi:DUF5958 family protein [Streptomyces capillispiralis]|uniref:DUF5958 family protein n=1 Tax=Streptomyces capillispiralis TaxID=68182 RepID=UPI00119D4DC2|nr:DUF5958 family protein [Streptomyces capillispiralis]